MYGSSMADMPPIFCTSSVCSLIIASITSSTVTMPRMWPRVVHHRDGEQVVLGDQPGDVFAVHQRAHGDRLAALADLGDRRFRLAP